MTRLILLDRDGVINQDSDEFVKGVDEFLPLPGVLAALADLHRAGFLLAVATNQSGVGRGLFTEETLADIHGRLEELLEAAGGSLAGLSYCPHLPDAGCRCRKPRPGLLLDLMDKLAVAPEETLFVGDSERDLKAALAAGVRPVLVLTGNGRRTESAARKLGVTDIYEDLPAFARALVAGCTGDGAQS